MGSIWVRRVLRTFPVMYSAMSIELWDSWEVELYATSQKYKPVASLIDALVSRFVRMCRKKVTRFFTSLHTRILFATIDISACMFTRIPDAHDTLSIELPWEKSSVFIWLGRLRMRQAFSVWTGHIHDGTPHCRRIFWSSIATVLFFFCALSCEVDVVNEIFSSLTDNPVVWETRGLLLELFVREWLFYFVCSRLLQ